ncbi:MAG: putative metal-binding motif-containing protein [Flavobacteriaceae bacterium]|nr:putative metal-binding motif-containing protein [Flavobacteriaceae bacterium]
MRFNCDCDDADAAINQLAPELAAGVDNDCIGDIDEGLITKVIWLVLIDSDWENAGN